MIEFNAIAWIEMALVLVLGVGFGLRELRNLKRDIRKREEREAAERAAAESQGR